MPIHVRPLRSAGLALALGAGLSSASCRTAAAQAPVTVYDTLATSLVTQVRLRYATILPRGYPGGGSWPLVLFLHGAGERGDDIAKVRLQGLPKLDTAGRLPYILVAPQIPEGEVWSASALGALLHHLEAAYRVDRSREYLTGLSMGAFGAWDLAMAMPDRFAAVVAISGGANPVEVCRLRQVPIWIVHGRDDDVIPVSWSETLARRLRRCGANVRVTIYPGVGHDAWTRTYADPEFTRWLLTQRRADRH
jgi:predicted peptidase